MRLRLATLLGLFACSSYGEAGTPAAADPGTTSADAGDAGAGQSSAPDAGADGGEAGTVRLIFVTSGSFNGDLGGLQSADDLCNEAAAHDGVATTIRGRFFRAWSSGQDESAASRHRRDAVPVVRPDGVQVASGWTDFSDAQLAAPINVDERGTIVTGDVWTGSRPDGEETVETCNSWTSSSAGAFGTAGSANALGAPWTESRIAACNSAGRLYCLEY